MGTYHNNNKTLKFEPYYVIRLVRINYKIEKLSYLFYSLIIFNLIYLYFLEITLSYITLDIFIDTCKKKSKIIHYDDEIVIMG